MIQQIIKKKVEKNFALPYNSSTIIVNQNITGSLVPVEHNNARTPTNIILNNFIKQQRGKIVSSTSQNSKRVRSNLE